MKKLLAVVMAVLMIAAVVVGCSEERKPSTPDTEPNSSVESYVNENKAAIESAFSNDQFAVTLDAKGSAVVYKYTYKTIDDVDDDTVEQMKDAANETLKLMDTQSMLDMIKAECSAVEKVVYEYYESDGDLLFDFVIE